MSFTFQGYQLTPGMHDERFTEEVQFLWGRWDQVEYVQALIDKDTVDSGHTDYTTTLRSGLALGVLTATGQFTQWNPYATDGSNYLVGFLIDEIATPWMGGTTKERLSAIVVKGNIKADQVIIPGETARGIDGKTYEFLLREQCKGRFLFDDDLGGYTAEKEYTIGAAVTSLTVTAAMNKTIFVTDTALGATCTLTLPAPRPGLEYHFAHPSTTAATTLVLDGPATNEFWVAGAAASTVTLAGDNTTGLRKVKCVRVTDTTNDVFAYVVDGVAA
jgi:hypothetical protein